MNNPKLEDQLNLALEATPREREQSLNLGVGFDAVERTWELIVKHTGSLAELTELGIRVVELQNEYAILTVPESRLPDVAGFRQIEYIEKPKRLYFAVSQGRQASCVTTVQNQRFGLFGRGILVAVLDSGVDYAHPDFRNEDGSSRILYLWDQTVSGKAPDGYGIGSEYTKEQLDEALRQPQVEARYRLVPSIDSGGHGTAVLGIAAGNGLASGGRYRGMAPESDLLVVKLGIPGETSFPRTTELMMGIDYAVRRAVELGLPVAVNVSFGNTYGSHDGTSLLETYLTDMANLWKSVFCIGTGNEGYADGHVAGVLREQSSVEFAVGEYEPALSIQLWKQYEDEMEVYLVHPGGMTAGPFAERTGAQRFRLGDTEALVYYGEPAPYHLRQEVSIELIPGESGFVDSGIWKLMLVPVRIVRGNYQMWLPSAAALNPGTRFLYPSSSNTLTIPSTAGKIVAVGAYDSRNLSYADFSGRGAYDRTFEGTGFPDNKPDLVAPGVDVLACAPGGGYEEVTGTSFATPFVTGAAALLMQWGITDGNDPYLYGEKVRAYLQRGAKPLPGFTEYPNPLVGYGALCLEESLPEPVLR